MSGRGLNAVATEPSPARASLAQLINLKAAGETLNLTTLRVRALGIGGHLSPFKGRGVEYDESRPDLPHIRVNLLVERDSQKQIVIGRGGALIKKIGVRARRRIEKLVGTQVHLALWVKVEPKWAKKPGRLRALGYR